MSLSPRLARKLLSAPLMLRQESVHMLLAELLAPAGAEPSALLPSADDERANGAEIIDGIAIIPVQGILVQQSDWLTDLFGMTGYDTITASFQAAQAHPDVRAIALHIDSPGGMVSGCFDLVDLMLDARGNKPVWSILDDGAYSAAYAIAAAADRITAPRAGGAGSIGVITTVPDISRMLDEAGITINMIAYGEAKTDGYPYAKLDSDARKRMQASIDVLGEIFVGTVARARSLTPAAVRATEANCYVGAQAQAAGLIDAVMTPAQAFAALQASL